MTSVRLWSNQTIKCQVVNRVLFMRLVLYKMEYIRANEPSYTVTESQWYPSWRVFDSTESAV